MSHHPVPAPHISWPLLGTHHTCSVPVDLNPPGDQEGTEFTGIHKMIHKIIFSEGPRSAPPPNSCAASNAKSKLERVKGTHDMKIQPPRPKLGIPDLRTITRTLHLTPFPLLAESVCLLRLMYQFSTILILVFHPFFHQSTESHVHSVVLPPLRLCQGETHGLIKRC